MIDNIQQDLRFHDAYNKLSAAIKNLWIILRMCTFQYGLLKMECNFTSGPKHFFFVLRYSYSKII